MASPASVTNLGSKGRPGPLPTAAVRRGHLVSRISFTGFDSVRRWPCAPGRLCRCMVITNLIDEKGAQFSSGGSVNIKADDENDLLSKPPQRPVRLNGPPANINTATTSAPAKKPIGVTFQDREKVRESLDEVLEKAEKLEASSSRNVDSENSALRQNDVAKPNSLPPTVVEGGSNSKRTKTLKSVWRKGNPVPTVHKVIRDRPRTETRDQSISAAKPSVSSPSKPAPPLLTRPSVVPPPRRPVKDGTSNEKKGPILIDKFASKRPMVDPAVAEALVDPVKPVRGSPAKVKDNRRKKNYYTSWSPPTYTK